MVSVSLETAYLMPSERVVQDAPISNLKILSIPSSQKSRFNTHNSLYLGPYYFIQEFHLWVALKEIELSSDRMHLKIPNLNVKL